MSQSGSTSSTAGSREAGTTCPHCSALIRLGDLVSTCSRCGTAHHEMCWRSSSGCGSYECAPAHRQLAAGSTPLRISQDELASAYPMVQPVPRGNGSYRVNGPPVASPAGRPRTNRLAIASLVLAIVGIPLFGLLTGLVAIVLGCIALGGIRHSRQKGSRLAACGVLLGLADVVGWIVLIVYVFAGNPQSQILEFQIDPEALNDLPPTINRAMRANVVIESQRGWGRLGGTSIGSGVILKMDRGKVMVLTNRHVVDARFNGKPRDEMPGDEVSVLLVGAAVPLPGEVVWVAPDGIDAALVRVVDRAIFNPHDARNGPMVTLWDAARRGRIGDPVFAIGNPQGLAWTHTQGSISQFRLQNYNGRQVRVVQTHTAINQGNSGGGLYDKDGHLLGINTWTQDKRASEGLSFAISLDSLAELFPRDLDLHPNHGK